MKPLIKFLVIIGMYLSAAISYAAELSPAIKDRHLGFTLTGVTWPQTLAKDFASGFENRILIRVEVLSDERLIFKTDTLIVEKYDLWEELFRTRVLVGEAVQSEKSINHIEEFMQQLHNLTVFNIFALNTLPQRQSLILQADILINPVERERIERVNKWVAENSVSHVPGGAARLTTKPNSIFNTIYDQYIHGADMAAPWKITIVSKPFVLQDLLIEMHSVESK